MFKLFSLLALWFPLALWAQQPLKRPLTFVPAQSILVIDPTDDNIVQRAMAVSPLLAPHTPQLSVDSVKHFRHLLRQNPNPSACDAHTLEQLFLLSGDARFVRSLDSLRHVYDAEQRKDSLSTAAAQRLLNTLGWVAAYEGRNLYVNLKGSCLIALRTPDFSVSIDQIVQDSRMKLRVSGLSQAQTGSHRTRFALRLCLPPTINARQIYLNGRRILDPHWEKGFLVLDREWRNMEEIYYECAE